MNMKDDNDTELQGSIDDVLEEAARNLQRHGAPGHSIARMNEGAGELVPLQLEERRLIHREESVRRQSDAFREIRTRLLGIAGQQNFA
jgi:protein-tyrosine kinase